MTKPRDLTLKFRIFRKVVLMNLCSERLLEFIALISFKIQLDLSMLNLWILLLQKTAYK